MERPHLRVGLVVAVLVLGSGCAMFTGSVTETPEPTATATSTVTPTATPVATPEPTPTATPTAQPTATPPATATPTATSTLDNWEQLLESHRQTVEDAESWQGIVSSRFGGDEAALGPTERNVTVGVFVEGAARRRLVLVEGNRTDSYTPGADSPTYVRTNESGAISYTRNGTVPSGEGVLEPPFDAEFLAGWNYTSGTVGSGGVERLKLSASGVDRMSQRNRDRVVGEIRGVSIEVYVDTEREVITRIDYALTVERSSGTVEAGFGYRMLDIGSYNLRQPTWLDEARNRTG